MQLINLTAHPVVLHRPTPQPPLVLPACPRPPRVPDTDRPGRRCLPDLTMPVVELDTGTTVDSLPEPCPGTVYVVGRLVAAAAPHRTDLFVPGPVYLDPRTGLAGCSALLHLHFPPGGGR
ncbi:hypothetical protein [Rhodococcus sp. YH1]|uniref:hypothetical protein n=1 Tax=Rhodococcus sp. YH1 TaxID=89066 RepID=UPI00138765AA|nr:hypothetical protein [Rhodococcus sp. YH1]